MNGGIDKWLNRWINRSNNYKKVEISVNRQISAAIRAQNMNKKVYITYCDANFELIKYISHCVEN